MQNTVHHDVIVIGSGIGGLTAAGLLARVAGRSVLVLERHLEPGGLTHSFRRDGASWDVGLHYVGQMEPGSMLRQLFDFLSDGELKWNRLPDPHERSIHPGVDFRVPSDPARYRQQLIDTWPDEARAIRRYFRDVKRAVRWANLGFAAGMVPQPVVPLLRLLRKWHSPLATQTTSDYLERHFRSPHLRALLASPWGDYGLPPSRSAFAMHAIIVSHYLEGAWYPAGGSSRIARCIEPAIEAHGGAVRVGQHVTDILIENGRAVGVKVQDMRGPQDTIREYRAPVIISDVGAALTYGRLLPQDDETRRHTAPILDAIRQLGHGLSAVALFVRLKDDARALGVQGENIWINTTLCTDDMAGQTRDTLNGNPRHVFLSFGGMNAGENRFHTAQILCFIDPAAFARWREEQQAQHGQRAHETRDDPGELRAHRDGQQNAKRCDASYLSLKKRIETSLLRCVENVIPGFSAQVMHAELATPFTFEDYSAHPQGCFYSLPATPERFLATWTGAQTPIPGLYLSGQDACIMGIGGAMMGGVAAACQVLGARGYPQIKAALRQTGKASKAPATGARPARSPSGSASQSGADAQRAPCRQQTSGHGAAFTPCAGPVSDTALPTGQHTEGNGMHGTPHDPFPSPAGQRTFVSTDLRHPPEKQRATLLNRKQLTACIWHVEFLLEQPVDDFSPGQFARIQVAPATWRDYSIASLDGQRLQCLISTRTGGLGSQFVTQAQPGTCTMIELPLGRYTLRASDRPAIFIATGTGIAPFLPMFRALQQAGRLQDTTLLFGCRTHADDLCQLLMRAESDEPSRLALPGAIIACYSRARIPDMLASDNAAPVEMHAAGADRPASDEAPAPARHPRTSLAPAPVPESAAARVFLATSGGIERDITAPNTAPGNAAHVPAHTIFHGRVTDALKSLPVDATRADFYLCGSGAMVADCQALLARLGATQVHAEPF